MTNYDHVQVLLDKVNEKNRLALLEKQPRVLTKPRFVDPEYNQLSNIMDYVFPRKMENNEGKTLLTNLKKNKNNRIQEISSFLERHNITINTDENNFTEFDSFYMKTQILMNVLN